MPTLTEIRDLETRIVALPVIAQLLNQELINKLFNAHAAGLGFEGLLNDHAIPFPSQVAKRLAVKLLMAPFSAELVIEAMTDDLDGYREAVETLYKRETGRVTSSVTNAGALVEFWKEGHSVQTTVEVLVDEGRKMREAQGL